MSALASRNPFWAVMSEEARAEAILREQECAKRRSQILANAALFGITLDDAGMIERDFRTNPENRRSEDLTKHTALTLRARKRFLSGGRKVAA